MSKSCKQTCPCMDNIAFTLHTCVSTSNIDNDYLNEQANTNDQM